MNVQNLEDFSDKKMGSWTAQDKQGHMNNYHKT